MCLPTRPSLFHSSPIGRPTIPTSATAVCGGPEAMSYCARQSTADQHRGGTGGLAAQSAGTRAYNPARH